MSKKKGEKTCFSYNKFNIDSYNKYKAFTSYKKFLMYFVSLLFDLNCLIPNLNPHQF